MDDSAVSRKHCELTLLGDTWVVRDLKSSNGTMVNGEKVGEKQLNDGDHLKIGHTELEFRSSKKEATKGGGGQNVVEETALWTLVELGVGAPDEKAWVTTYLETLLKHFHSDRGFVVTYNPKSGASTPVAAVAIEFGAEESEGEVTISRSIVDQAIKERRAVITTNAELDPRFREATSVAKYDIRAVVCIPTRWQGEPTGAIYLERIISEEAYSEEEARSLQDFADLLGIALKAWEGHIVANREEWEREALSRNFSEGRVTKIIEAGGAETVKRGVREVTVMEFRLGRLEEMLLQPNEEAWKQVSQLYSQLNDIILRHDGALIWAGTAMFGGLEGESTECHIEAVKTAVEIQRAARGLLKRLVRETKQNLTLGVGVATGQALAGFFGSGKRDDFIGVGEVFSVAAGLAVQAQDGEILADQNCYGKIHVFVNTHRLPPVNMTGVDRQIQVYRVVPF